MMIANRACERIRPIWEQHPYRLVSLRGIIMRSFYAGLFLSAARMLDAVGISKSLILTDATKLTVEQRARLRELVLGLEQDCIGLGLTATATSVHRLLDLLAEPQVTDQQVHQLKEEINGRLGDELAARVFLSLSAHEAEYYSTPQKGWNEIIDRFPDTVIDIEEAAKCFALARYAASVFHSVQVVEIGLMAICKFLNVSDPKSGFTAATHGISRILKKDSHALTKDERRYRDFLEQLQVTIEALKNAWRNKISHAQGRLTIMTSTFAPEVAEEILFATRAFMRRLATELPKRSLRPDAGS